MIVSFSRFFACLAVAVVVLSASASAAHVSDASPVAPPINSVNLVLGDISFVDTFGRLPNADDAELLRLRTHLAYVEARLRETDVSHLSQDQRVARGRILDRLHEYTQAGAFPTNYDLPGRRPCFIDRDGNICAVGYLVERSAGREVAETINAQYQYASIDQIDTPILDGWLEQFGLTRLEAAMIQPAYPAIEEATVENGGGWVMVCPDGTGPSLAGAGLVVTGQLTSDGTPVPGYPRQDIWLGPAPGDPSTAPFLGCAGGTLAAFDTDANGYTSFTMPLQGGGYTETGLVIYTSGVSSAVIPLFTNSPDINGDRVVNLSDLGIFAGDFFGVYNVRSDLADPEEGNLNLSDVARIATHMGSTCP